MFKNIYLGNFKAFGPTQRIPIRPLTLIFGPNSAGKSSFIHGLLYAHDAQTSDEPNNLDVKRPRLGGDSVDLGGFRQFIHKKNVGNTVEWGVEFDTAELTGRLAELLAPVRNVAAILNVGVEEVEVDNVQALPSDLQSHKIVDVSEQGGKARFILGPRVETFQLKTDSDVLLRASIKRRGKETRLGVDELDSEHPIVRTIVRAIVESTTTTESLKQEDTHVIQDAVNELVPDLSLLRGRFVPNGVERRGAPQGETTQATLFPISKGNRKEDLRQAILFFLPRTLNELVRELETLISQSLKTLRYLGPLRSYPPRHLAFAQYHDPNWHAGGGFAWDRVRTDPTVREAANEWLGSPRFMQTPYQLVVRDLFASDDLEDVIWTTMENVELDMEVDGDREGPTGTYPVIKDFDREIENFQRNLRNSQIESIQDLVLVDVNRKTIVSHRDIGIGVSQVLPVLVAAFAADDETVAIEQPEIHLHPALQAELGDVFIKSALNGKKNHFLLETHSEHLILRIMRRMRETADGELPEGMPPVRPDDVTVLYVEPRADGSGVRILELDQEGEFLDPWPGGFFEEGFRERFGK